MSAKPPRSRLRRLLPGALALLLVLGAGHAALWWLLAGRLEQGFAAWAAMQRQSGRSVTHGPPSRGGWPFVATLTLPGFAWAEPGLGIATEALTLVLAPPRLDRLRLEAPGRHVLRLGTEALPLAAASLHAEFPLEAAPLPSELVATGEGIGLGGLTLRRLALRLETQLLAPATEPAISLSATLDGLELPAEAGPPVAVLGRAVESLALEAALSGPLPQGPATAPRAAAWRDAGGALSLRSLALRWGPLALQGEGRFGLDAALQPRGGATLRLAGGEQALEAAAAAGLLPPANLGAGRLLLRLLGRTPPGGGPAEIEAPLSLEDRMLTVARLPLGQLPAWRWAPR